MNVLARKLTQSILPLRCVQLHLPPATTRQIHIAQKLCRFKYIGVQLSDSLKDEYAGGQYFVHKKLSYNGIILNPVKANVVHGSRSYSAMYYAVMMDFNSVQYMSESDPENIIPMGDPWMPEQRLLDPRPSGLGFASHDDIFPYEPPEPVPINHPLFTGFFEKREEVAKFLPRQGIDAVSDFLDTPVNIEEIKVYIADTHNIRVTAIPFGPMGKNMRYRYCIRIENPGSKPVQLKYRHWKIFSDTSQGTEEVQGEGVVGKQPILSREKNPVFQYTSFVKLDGPTGKMWGYYVFEDQGGNEFEVRIPKFILEPIDKRIKQNNRNN